MRAALYARFSTDNQREASIDDQFRQCQRAAEQAGLEVVAHFSDAGITAGTAARPGYQSCLAAARSGGFEVIVAEDVSRLWRSRAEFGSASSELEDLGVHLLTCVGDDTRRDGYGLVLGIKHAIAEAARRETSFRTRRALEGLALAGKPTGPLPYGYAPGQAETVRRMFKQRQDGMSLAEIAGDLNQWGIAAPRGGRWGTSTVAYVLANARYAGTAIWGRTEGKGGARDSRLRRRVKRSGGPLVTRAVEPLLQSPPG